MLELAVALGELDRAVPHLHLQAPRVLRFALQLALLGGPQPVDDERSEQRITHARPPGGPRRGSYRHGERQPALVPDTVAVGGAHAEHVVAGGQIRVRHAALRARFHPAAVESLQHVPITIGGGGCEIERRKLERHHRVLVPE